MTIAIEQVDWSAIALTLLVAMPPAVALTLALEPYLRNRRMRSAASMFVFGCAAITALWLMRHPHRLDDLVAPLAENIVKYGYPAVALSAIASSLAASKTTNAADTAPAESIERQRRTKLLISASIGASGIIAASLGIYLDVSAWRWFWLAGGWLGTMAATVMILFIVRPHVVPNDRAIAQPGGRCFKPGDRYLPTDKDRLILMHRRMDIVRPREQIRLRASGFTGYPIARISMRLPPISAMTRWFRQNSQSSSNAVCNRAVNT